MSLVILVIAALLLLIFASICLGYVLGGGVEVEVPKTPPVAPPMHAVLVLMDGWDGLYLDGELVAEADTLFACDGIRALAGRFALTVADLTLETPEFCKGLPKRFADLEGWVAENPKQAFGLHTESSQGRAAVSSSGS